jgi:hypothetical protein
VARLGVARLGAAWRGKAWRGVARLGWAWLGGARRGAFLDGQQTLAATMIAALFVDPHGVYADLPDVEVWDRSRDARTYTGPHRVIAHPPCERWGRYWGGAPLTWPRKIKGDDGGSFAAAIAAVRTWGGVLEHPMDSAAWQAFRLNAPDRCGGWVMADWEGGWTCCVEQGAYGHRARKATWLYANGVNLPSLRWGRAPGSFNLPDEGCHSKEELARRIRTGICQRLSARQRSATPPEFRDMLISMVRQEDSDGQQTMAAVRT